MTNGLHADELRIDGDLVSRLISSQFPQVAALPLRRLDAFGSTNVLFRLGDELLVRLPRQPGGGAGVDKERRWVPELRPFLPVAVPEVVGFGEPGSGFGERWSIVRWLEGLRATALAADKLPSPERSMLAADLADVILALRAIDVPDEAVSDPALRWYRGRSLAEFDEPVRRSVQQCRSLEGLDVDLDAALGVWADALDVPGAREVGDDRWYHGDVVAENLLLSGGRLAAVLDFDGLGVGDPTVDLHGVWELFDAPAREVFRAQLGVDEAEWLRGRAWALARDGWCTAGSGRSFRTWTPTPGSGSRGHARTARHEKHPCLALCRWT